MTTPLRSLDNNRTLRTLSPSPQFNKSRESLIHTRNANSKMLFSLAFRAGLAVAFLTVCDVVVDAPPCDECTAIILIAVCPVFGDHFLPFVLILSD